MEDCCAVCAEPLEWIGYGPCGHREVCYLCTARLRFVLNDKRCCICKQDCPTVYVTKALGDYTRLVTDWTSLIHQSNSSRQGSLWYDNVVEAYFDDEEPFKIIKAMCRLYCVMCEKATGEDAGVKGMVKKGHIFRNIDTLQRHQFTIHKISMCELCLEGRKVFISEQKLYSKSQLVQHSSKGDSEVDGNEEERGGFAGHPKCAFCRKRFYGDNELYQHMSQEHYTCHICQRARPGHYEYYRNYDDLEAHFRKEHALCEDSECLAKKFVVFPSEAELKRHNATTHGGHMSRSQRNAALQIPVSFQFRRPGQDFSDDNNGNYSSRRGGRGRGGHPLASNARSDQLSAAVQANVDPSDLEDALVESLVLSSSNDTLGTSNPEGAVDRSSSAELERVTSVAQAGGEQEPSRYLTAVWGGGPSTIGDAEAFPPLPGTSKSARRRATRRAKQKPASLAALLGGNGLGGNARGGIRVLNAADDRLPPGPSQPGSSASAGVETVYAHQGLNIANWEERVGTLLARTDEPGQVQSVSVVATPVPPPVAILGATSRGNLNISNGLSSRDSGGAGERQPNQIADLSMEEIRAANKALIERIRAGLEGNEQQFADFKDVSSSFRKGEMSSQKYYGHIARLGLSHVVPELARLCPDRRQGQELLDAHTAQLTRNVVDPRNLPPGLAGAFSSSSSFPALPTIRSPAPDLVDIRDIRVSDVSAKSSLGNTSRAHADDGEVEVLSTDGYRRQKGKSKIIHTVGSSSSVSLQVPSTEGSLLNELAAARDRTPQVLVRSFPPLIPESSRTPAVSQKPSARLEGGWPCGLCTLLNPAGSLKCAACGAGKPGEDSKGVVDASGGNEKRKKKISKFQRVRLGDASALLDSTPSNPWGQTSETEDDNKNTSGSYGRGVWNNGGGQRLVSMAQR